MIIVQMTQSEKEQYSSEKPVQNDHAPFGNNISADTGQWEIEMYMYFDSSQEMTGPI